MLQQYTDEWNEVAKDTIANEAKIYFVDVNKQLSEPKVKESPKAVKVKVGLAFLVVARSTLAVTFLTGSNSCFCGNTSCKTK